MCNTFVDGLIFTPIRYIYLNIVEKYTFKVINIYQDKYILCVMQNNLKFFSSNYFKQEILHVNVHAVL